MIIVLCTLLVLIVIFSMDRIPPDSAVLMALIILVLTKTLTPQEAFQGFGSDLLVILASIFVISSALQHNGVVEHFSSRLANLKVTSEKSLIALVMIPIGLTSSFMNNTTVAAIAVLPIMELCRRIKLSPSKLLMPMAFASLLGGTCTLIGTSTNIAGNNFLKENGLKTIGMFELMPIGITLLIVCTLIFAFLGKYILPESATNDESKHKRIFYSHFWMKEELMPNGLTGEKLKNEKITFVRAVNPNGTLIYNSEYKFQEGDLVFICASSTILKSFFHKHVLKKLATDPANLQLAEIMVLPSSFINNSTLKDTKFYDSTGFRVTGVYRKNLTHLQLHKNLTIKSGDILLVEGSKESIQQVRENHDFIILNDEKKVELPQLRKGFIALLIFIMAVILSSTQILPMSISFLSAALIIVSFNLIPTKAVYAKVDWRLIILIGGMTAFGTAVRKTGADEFLASLITQNMANLSPMLICLAFMIITVLLTQPLSNAAAALVVLPVALQTARNLNVDPRSFCLAIILSASISMVTPFEPASLLVLNPGKYRIIDFFKIGGTLTVICLIIILFMINAIYGF